MLTFMNVWMLVFMGVFQWSDCAPTGEVLLLDGQDVAVWACEAEPEPEAWEKEPEQRERRAVKVWPVRPTRAR